MKTTLALLGIIFALLAALEILSAIYMAFRRGVIEETGENAEAPSLVLLPFVLLRYVILLVAALGNHVSLMVHEVSHAIMQGVFLGRPRVVLCKNGGYAQSQPWVNATPAHLLYQAGNAVGAGLMGLAPILIMSAILYGAFVALTPLDANAIVGQASYLVHDVGGMALWDIADSFWTVLWHTSLLGIVGIIVTALLMAPAMTPSSVDYYQSRWHLLAYALAFAVSAKLLATSPQATKLLLMGGAGAIVLAVAMVMTGPKSLRSIAMLIGCSGFWCAVIGLFARSGALGADPLLGLQRVLGVVVAGLLLAASFYVVFVAFFLLTALATPKAIIRMLGHVPGELYQVVTKFDTCPECSLHFRKVCDGCGRTVEEIDAAKQAKHEADNPAMGAAIAEAMQEDLV